VPLTQTGQVIGTAHYLSPEQAQGARATPASDVYALGMVAYECLSGRRAFDGENSVQIALMQIREVPPSLPPDVPPAVRQLVRAALAKDPAQRLPDGAAFRDAVDAVLAGRMPVLPTEATSSILVPGLLPGLVPTPSDVPDTDPVVAPAEAPSGRWRPRSPMRSRPRLVAACVAALAAGLVVAGVLHAGGTPITTAAEGAGSGPVPASAPAPRTVQLNPDDYVGLPLGDVEARLAALGLQVGVRQITTADVPAGQVIALGPTGQLAPGQTVTVTVAAAPAPAPAAPTPTPGGAVQAASGGAATARPPSAVPSPVVVQQAGQTAPKNDRGNGRGGGKGKQGDD
jgi:serine/threonine-protein kinase